MRKSLKKILTAFALTAALAMPAQAPAEVVDRIVAIINDSIITMSELNAATAIALENLSLEDKKDSKKIVEVKSRILDSLIEQKLIKQASDKAGIEISEREIDNAVEDVKRQNDMTQDALLLALTQNGLTYREYREQLKEQIRQVKFINKEFRSKIGIQPEEIEDYYKQNVEEFLSPLTFRIQMIFVPSNDQPLMKKRLEIIKGGIARGEDFGELARDYSEGPEASKGGDLGYLKSGELDSGLEEIVKKLKKNEIAAPITMPEGVYIVKLLDTRLPEPRTLQDVTPVIHDKLFKKIMDERFNFWLKEVKKFAHIEVRL